MTFIKKEIISRLKGIHKVCRKYLSHIQKPVFEGSITQGQLNKLKAELKRIIDYDDAICVYSFANVSGMVKEQIGVVKDNSSIIWLQFAKMVYNNIKKSVNLR